MESEPNKCEQIVFLQSLVNGLSKLGVAPVTAYSELVDIICDVTIEILSLRSLSLSFIQLKKREVHVVRQCVFSYLTSEGEKTHLSSLQRTCPDIYYKLDDDNITCDVARSGELTVMDRFCKEKLDHRFDNKTTWGSKLAIFIPCYLPPDNETNIVLGTGCERKHWGELKWKIDQCQPLFERLSILMRYFQEEVSPGGLTELEIEVVKLMVSDGMRVRDIAETLHRSQRTIEGWISNIYDKLNIRTPAQLGLQAAHLNIVANQGRFVT